LSSSEPHVDKNENNDASTAPASDGPLTGLRVIELGHLLAGPHAGRLLAELGAELIKIEEPGRPDRMREWGQARYEGKPVWWLIQSRNKKCITLNVRTARGRGLFLELVARSDVLIENFRPGTLESWELGPATLAEVNPGLVVARVSGYGQTGPYAARAGFASVSEAMGGLRHINGFEGEPPPRIHISLGDTLAGMLAVQGILAAIYHRDVAGGSGQVVDVSLLEASFAMLESVVPEYDLCGYVRGPGGTGLKGVAPSNIFKSQDDQWMVIAANHDAIFERLCTAMGMPELAADPRFATYGSRGEHQAELERIVAEWARRYPASEIDRLLNEAGVICGPIYSVEDMFEDEHFWERAMLLRHSDPEIGDFVGPGLFPKFSETPPRVRWTGPSQPGSHNGEIYRELLGMTGEQVSELNDEGVI